MIFELFTEDGAFRIDYADYCKRPDLMRKIGDDTRVFVNLGLKILSFDKRYLEGHKGQAKFVADMAYEREQNPVRFFLPHCADYPDFSTPSHAFLADNTSVYTGIVAGNRYGKTVLAWIKMLTTFGLIECDPKWEIFTEHGVTFTDWTGPKEIAVVTYEWSNHRKTVWPQVIKQWTPKAILGQWAQWEVPSVTTGPVIPLTNESILNLMACSQPQSAFESQALDNVYWDEQGVEAKFDGMEARLKTRRRYRLLDDGTERLTRGAHLAAMTPHKLPDRPDSGGGTWIHKMYKGELTKGVTSKFYHGNKIKDVPDWIYSERQKQADLAAEQEAERTHDRKRLRQIKSRLYGDFEESGGLVYDEWDKDVHVIAPFEIPSNWCMIRAGDHGRTNPCAWLWIAISPENIWVMFREYEGLGLTVSQNVEQIVKYSGNRLEDIGQRDFGSHIVKRRREVFDAEHYLMDVMDGRSFQKPSDGAPITLGEMYQDAGLSRLQKAPIDSAGTSSRGIMLVKELLTIDPELKHLQTGEPGGPRLYVFSTCRKFIEHIGNYRNRQETNDDGNPSEKPANKDDHDMDALRYGALAYPRWNPCHPCRPNRMDEESFRNRKKWWIKEDRKDGRKAVYDRFTGCRL